MEGKSGIKVLAITKISAIFTQIFSTECEAFLFIESQFILSDKKC